MADEKTLTQEEINKADLENKSAIMQQIKASLLEAKDDLPTGITIHYKDRTITYFPYVDRVELKKTHAPVINQIIDLLTPLLDAESEIHKTSADKITISKTEETLNP